MYFRMYNQHGPNYHLDQWRQYQNQGQPFFYPTQALHSVNQPHFTNPSYGIAPYSINPNANFGTEGQYIQSLFDDPLYPIYNPQENYGFTPILPTYPMNQPPRPKTANSWVNSFKDQEGNVDFNKMLGTAGQFVGVVNQVQALVKGFGQIFKV